MNRVIDHEAVLAPGRRRKTAGRIRRAARKLLVQATAAVRRRSLLGETLALHLAVAAVVGALAFGGLWWASNLLIRDQMRTWGEQWLDNLDDLAVPLYASGDAEWPVAYVDQFAEISFVRYYSRAGQPIRTEVTRHGDAGIAPLERARLEALASRGADLPHHLVETMFRDRPLVRIAEPIWATSVPADGLLGFDPNSTAVNKALTGYVELGLDFSGYRAYEARAVLTAVSIGAGVLLLLTTASWLISRRALRPLSALQLPLQRLADGETNFDVATTGHREIVAIADALRAAAGALDQRQQRLHELANRDQLTGLPNRRGWDDEIAREFDVPVLCNIHDVQLATEFATKIIGLQDGAKIFEGPTAALDRKKLDKARQHMRRIEFSTSGRNRLEFLRKSTAWGPRVEAMLDR